MNEEYYNYVNIWQTDYIICMFNLPNGTTAEYSNEMVPKRSVDLIAAKNFVVSEPRKNEFKLRVLVWPRAT